MHAAYTPTKRSAAGVVNGVQAARRKKRSTLWQRATLFRVEIETFHSWLGMVEGLPAPTKCADGGGELGRVIGSLLAGPLSLAPSLQTLSSEALL